MTILRADGREQTYRIVGEDEADPARGTISYVSPVARALLGKQVGEVVRVGQSDIELVANCLITFRSSHISSRGK
jgi:transcription elongation GreA/GreB family factor